MSSEHERTSVSGTFPPPTDPVVVAAPVEAQPLLQPLREAVVAEPVVVEPVAVVAAPMHSERVATYSRVTPARAFTAIGGIILLVIGLIAVAKTGIHSPLDQPIVKVAGMTHTPLLGIIGAVAGLLLLASSVTGSDAGARSSGIFFGVLLGVAGVVAIATPESFHSLALQSSYGWMALIIGAVVVIANLLLPTITAKRVTYR